MNEDITILTYELNNSPIEYLQKVDTSYSILHIFFPGAISRGKHIDFPIFQRKKWLEEIKGSVLIVQDPMVNASNNLLTSWMLYDDEQFYKAFSQVIKNLLVKLGLEDKDCVLYGSSAGGFNALYMSKFFPEASVITINPQINIIRYVKQSEQIQNDLSYIVMKNYNLTLDEFILKYSKHYDIKSIFDDGLPDIYFVINKNDGHHYREHFRPFDEYIKKQDTLSIYHSIIYAGPKGHTLYGKRNELELLEYVHNHIKRKPSDQYISISDHQIFYNEKNYRYDYLPFKSIQNVSFQPLDIEDINLETLRINNLDYLLHPKVKWDQQAEESLSYQVWKYSLIVLTPLIDLYEKTKNKEVLKKINLHITDFISYVETSTQQNTYVYNDMSVSTRSVILAYILRVNCLENTHDKKLIHKLFNFYANEVTWLLSVENYVDNHNHGLYMDIALLKSVRYIKCFLIDEHDITTELILNVTKRFSRNLQKKYRDGEYLINEHSPGYHFVIQRILKEYNEAASNIGIETFDTLLKQMIETSSWLVYPDGTLPQIGDTTRMGNYYIRDNRGLKRFHRTGYSIFKGKDFSLFFHATYHSKTHKHNDELSFELFDFGRRIFIDSGNYGYDYNNKYKKYALSVAAHNGLEIVGLPMARDTNHFYNSGIISSELINGVYISSGINQIYKQFGYIHNRILVYSPRKSLHIIDVIRSESTVPQKIKRYFHFESDILVKRDTSKKNDVLINAKEFNATMSFDGNNKSFSIYNNDHDLCKGIYFPDDHTIQSNYMVEVDEIISSKTVLTTCINFNSYNSILNIYTNNKEYISILVNNETHFRINNEIFNISLEKK